MVYYTDQIGDGIGVEPQGYVRNDDDVFGPFPLGFNLTYFGQQYDQFFINTNGNISFGQGVTDFTPQSLDTTAIAPIIAPYWADIDTRPSSGGTVTLRNDIPNQVIITWDQVGYFDEKTDKLASLQLVLRGPDFNVPPGEGDIGFFYKDIQWETGDEDGGVGGFGGTEAAAGFGDGLLTVNPGEVAIAASQQPGISQSLSNTSVWFQLGQGGIPIGNERTQTPATVLTNAIQGTKWEDVEGNGVRDGDDLVSGDRPNVVFVVDVSVSARRSFLGTSVGDLNQDGIADTILDAEIAAVKALNDALIARGLGQTAQVSIVSFDDSAISRDMDPNAPGDQLFTTPEADSNGNGIRDVEEVAQGLTFGGGTSFPSALQGAINAVNNLNPASSANVIFLSDGEDRSNFADEVTELQNLGVNLRAFGVGSGTELGQLQAIDSNAQIFTTTDELLGVFGGQGGGTTAFTDPPIPGVTIYLDLNNNGSPDAGEPTAVTGATGEYIFPDLAPGTYTVREIVPNGFSQTFPAGGGHIVTVGTDNTEGLDFGNFENQESTLEFSSSFYQTAENGTPIVTVTRTGGTGPVSATVSLSPATAQPGLDYQNVSFPVTFADGDFQPKPVPIPLIDDDEFEEVERGNLTLSDIQGNAVPGPQGTAILEILDNDIREPATLEFSSSFFQTTENGTPAIVVTRTGGSEAVSATVSLLPATAQSGLDYQEVSIPVSFAEGDFQPKTVSIPLIDDAEFEGTEQANLTLGDIQGNAIPGLQGTAALQIIDNEPPPPSAGLPPATIGPSFEGLGNFTRITDLQGVAVSPNAITLVARDAGGLGFFDSAAVPSGNTVVGYDTGQFIVLDLTGILSQRPGAPTGVQSGTISFAYASPNVAQTVTFRDRNRNILSQETLPLTIPGPDGEFNQFQQFETALPQGTQIIELGSQATEIVFNDIRLNADSNTAPTDIILTNNTIPENAPNGTIVGDLIAVDAEGNNTQNFTLLDSAGDRFQIFGNLLTVANDELLDFESSTSHSITVRTTDSIGEFFEEQFAINITNVPEEASASIPTPVSTPTAIGETDPGGIVPILTASDIFAGF